MKEIRIAFIGTGVISHQHVRKYLSIPNAKIVAACDIDSKRLNEWCDKYGIPEKDRYTDYSKLLARDDIDQVDVCVHNNLHTPLSIEVMRSGKVCYCEKPMAGSYYDAKTLYDAMKALDGTLEIQLGFVFSPASQIARRMVEKGDLGHVYHARSVGYRRRLRPGLDVPPPHFSRDFVTRKWAEHGALYDMGVYHISQLLYVLGTPKLERVSGTVYQEIKPDPRVSAVQDIEVEEMGCGFARYENGLTMDIIETWAINMDDLGTSFIAGSKGGLRFLPLEIMPLTQRPVMGLKFITELDGRTVTTDLEVGSESNVQYENIINPSSVHYSSNQNQLVAYQLGLIDKRIDTPWLALQTMLVTEGMFLSGQLGREVTADEIEELSVSTAVRRQETEWGVFEYEF